METSVCIQWRVLIDFVVFINLVFLFLTFVEIEAKEACTWLRAAGFPQYAQLYEGKDIFNLYLLFQVHLTENLLSTFLDSTIK